MQLYENRGNQNSLLVSVIYVDVIKNLYKVWVEYIPCRLKNIKMIDMTSAIVILKEASKGFEKLCEMGWYLRITEDMILFNRFGFVKVWLSKYLHLNVPSAE